MREVVVVFSSRDKCQFTRVFLAVGVITVGVGWEPTLVWANPREGTVVSGQATISQPDTSTLHIDQSTDRAIIDWRSFDIAPNETTRFLQPARESWTLNRVTGSQDPSQLLGTLSANGNVAIVNPDGILFGQNARIDVGGLIATTHDITNDDFMSGRLNFTIPGNQAASIVNLGDISIRDRGIAAFVAPGVRNEGVIAARLGKVNLAAANGFTLDFYGDGLISLMVGDEVTKDIIDVSTGKKMPSLVANTGRISANGGVVALTSATARRAVNSVINNTGFIEARSVAERNGKIILGARTAKQKTMGAPRQTVFVSGKIDVSGDGTGGTGGSAYILGEDIRFSSLKIDATGLNAGGKVLVGGDYMGGNGDPRLIARYDISVEPVALGTASTAWLGNDVAIDADAIENGKGGKIVVWSDHETYSGATLTARGGNQSGDGGFIETSGKENLVVETAADASAKFGKAGTWLLDPNDIIIYTPNSSFNQNANYTQTSVDNTTTFTHTSGQVATISSGLINQALNTGSDIVFNASNNIYFSYTAGTIRSGPTLQKTIPGSSTISFYAGNNISMEDVTFAAANGALNVHLEARNGDIIGSTSFGSQFYTNGGNLTLDAANGSVKLRDTVMLNGGNLTISAKNDITGLLMCSGSCANATNNIGNLSLSAGTIGQENYSYHGAANNFEIQNTITGQASLIGMPFTATLNGSVTNTINIAYAGGTSGQESYSYIVANNFGRIDVDVASSLQADAIDLRIKSSDGDYIGAVYDRSTGFSFKDTGLNLLQGVLGITNAKGIKNEHVGREIEIDANWKGAAFDNGVFLIDGLLTLNSVANLNGSTPVVANFPFSGTGNVRINESNAAPRSGLGLLQDISFLTDENWSGRITSADIFSDDGGVEHLSLTATGLPSGVIFADNGDGSGTFALSGSVTSVPAGTFTATITATDEGGKTVDRNVTFTITQQVVTPTTPANPVDPVDPPDDSGQDGSVYNRDVDGVVGWITDPNDPREIGGIGEPGMSLACNETGTCWDVEVGSIHIGSDEDLYVISNEAGSEIYDLASIFLEDTGSAVTREVLKAAFVEFQKSAFRGGYGNIKWVKKWSEYLVKMINVLKDKPHLVKNAIGRVNFSGIAANAVLSVSLDLTAELWTEFVADQVGRDSPEWVAAKIGFRGIRMLATGSALGAIQVGAQDYIEDVKEIVDLTTKFYRDNTFEKLGAEERQALDTMERYARGLDTGMYIGADGKKTDVSDNMKFVQEARDFILNKAPEALANLRQMQELSAVKVGNLLGIVFDSAEDAGGELYELVH